MVKQYKTKRYVKKYSAKRRVVLYRQPKTETKMSYWYLGSEFASISNTWVELDVLGAITQGSNYVNNRIGNKISVMAFELYGTIKGGTTGGIADDSYNCGRLVISQFNLTKNGVAINPFYNQSIDRNLPLSKRNVNGLAWVYRDKYIPMNISSNSGTTMTSSIRNVKEKIRFKKPINVTFTQGGTHYNQTQLYVAMVTDSAVIPHPGFISGYVKVWYKDA